jgi:hypothetical protein
VAQELVEVALDQGVRTIVSTAGSAVLTKGSGALVAMVFGKGAAVPKDPAKVAKIVKEGAQNPEWLAKFLQVLAEAVPVDSIVSGAPAKL